jgi:hypothetical protein
MYETKKDWGGRGGRVGFLHKVNFINDKTANIILVLNIKDILKI